MASSVALKLMYAGLTRTLRELQVLKGIEGLLAWDELTMLPPASSQIRGDQKAILAGVVHDKQTDYSLGIVLTALNTVVDSKDTVDTPIFSAVQKAVIRDAHKSYVRCTTIPKDLVTRMAKLETDGYTTWVAARKAKDFSMFAPVLQEWVDCNRMVAKFINPDISPYDVLLDKYEKGMTSERLDGIFNQVKLGLVPLISAIKLSSFRPSTQCIEGAFSIDAQAKMCQEIAVDLGNLDKSVYIYIYVCVCYFCLSHYTLS